MTMREPGRCLVLVLLVTTMLFCATRVAEAAWMANSSGPQRGLSISMPGGQTPSATRTGFGLTNTVVIQRPLIYGTTFASAFNVYRSTSGGSLVLVTLSSCTLQPTTVTCIDSFSFFASAFTYTYAVRPRHGVNWIGAQSAASAPAV